MEKVKKEYKGIVVRPFTLAGKKADKDGKNGIPVKEYKTGEAFSTTNRKFFESLTNKKRIK